VRRRWLIGAVLAGVAAVAVSGCSSVLDTKSLEDEIGRQLAANLEVEPAQVTVQCPDSIAVEAGSVVRCTAEADEVTYGLKVTQTDDEGAVEWEIESDSSAVSDADGSGSNDSDDSSDDATVEPPASPTTAP
jgi:predicted transcriptional regulator